MRELFKVIGVMRFSVLTPTYYGERFDTIEETAAHIYSKDRMAVRFHIFENLVLPALVQQTDPDFDLVILSGEAMPVKYKSRLRMLLAPYPNFHLRFIGIDKHYQQLKRGFNSIPMEGIGNRLMFRLDDDDALGIAYVERLKVIAEGLMEFMGPDVPQVIGFNRGFHVHIKEGAENDVFDSCERLPLSAGMALLAPVESPLNPYRYNHRNSPQHFNTYTDIQEPMYIRTIHNNNKSTPAQSGQTRRYPVRRIERHLNKYFATGLAALKAL